MSSNVTDPLADVVYPSNIVTREQKRNYLRRLIDQHGFNWRVYGITAVGFFTDSYNLFATNVILPSLCFCYWPNAGLEIDTLINCTTLGGSICGQILFGILADSKGRNKLYGKELLIVIFSTALVAATSTGIKNSISPEAWVAAWRFLMGIGIGAEYPLSAALCTEWASTKARARMMAALFFMQPLGQLFAQLVGYWVLIGYDNKYDVQNCASNGTCQELIDGVWRWTAGVGGIPAAFAIWFRYYIKDPGLYDLEVQNMDQRALTSTVKICGPAGVQIGTELGNVAGANGHAQQQDASYKFRSRDMWSYLKDEGNWRYLLGTSICWFLLDFAFYGLGMGNPRTLAKLWTYYPSDSPLEPVPNWNANAAFPNATIYDALKENALQNIYTVSIASCAGSFLLIFLIDYLPRRGFLIISFVWLSVLLTITGGTFFKFFHSNEHIASVILVAICHFSFNFGANALTFIIPAEIFPTRYRCTFHGIAAASGKAGSIVVQGVLLHMSFNNTLASNPNSNGLGYIFLIWASVMALGAVFAWAWIPAVQNDPRDERNLKLPNKTLEDLGRGYRFATMEERQVIGFRAKISEIFRCF